MNIFDIANNTIKRFNMISANDKVLISISGGPDSVFLTFFLSQLKEKYKIELYAFHLDHMTRNGESLKDAEFVKRFCSSLSIPLFSERIDVIKWCEDRKLNFQEGARILRKEFLDKISSKNCIDKIAIAHNADDSIETFFINLLRGSGLRGMSSIKPFSGNVIRPLINIHKKDIVSYLDEHKIEYCIDYTNLENNYFRNKVRLTLIPFLENNFRKDIKKQTLKAIESIREADEYLERVSIKVLQDIVKEKNINNLDEIKQSAYLAISQKALMSIEPIIRKRIIINLIGIFKGDIRDIGERKINNILKLIEKSETVRLDIDANVKILVTGGFIYFFDASRTNIIKIISKDFEETKNYFLKRELVDKDIIILDDLVLDDSKDYYDNKIIKKGKLKRYIKEFNVEFEFKILDKKDIDLYKLTSFPKNIAFFDFSKIRFPLVLRSWRNGDFFKPFGEKYFKKLHDFFIDNKIPKPIRGLIPLICDKERILWVFPYRINEDVKVNKTSDKILYIKIIY